MAEDPSPGHKSSFVNSQIGLEGNFMCNNADCDGHFTWADGSTVKFSGDFKSC